jgi:plasmid maintenance system antidote protein VapI/deoxycytidine triphosphate deaminase
VVELILLRRLDRRGAIWGKTMLDHDQFAQDDPPAHPTTPAEYLRLEMARRGLTAITLAGLLKVHPQTLYNVLGKDQRKISPKLAQGLSRQLGRTVDFWLAEKLPLHLVEPAEPEAGAETADEGWRDAGDGVPGWDPSNPPDLQVDWQIRKYLLEPGSGLAIKTLDENCVRSVSIDLSIGFVIVDKYDLGARDRWTLIYRTLTDPETENHERALEDSCFAVRYFLEPGHSAIVVSREDFVLGANFVGRVGQNTGVLLSGLQVLHGLQIDPGYSGPLFMRVFNTTAERLEIQQGARLATVEVERLPVMPEKKYQENSDSRIARLAEDVFDKIAGLFTYTDKDGVVYKAKFEGAIDWTYASDKGDVQESAVDWIKSELANEAAPDHAEIVAAVQKVIDELLIRLEDAEALHQHFGISKHVYDTVAPHFSQGRWQTLADTIKRLGRRSAEIVTKLLDEAIEGRHA